jgi:hypothetical protein
MEEEYIDIDIEIINDEEYDLICIESLIYDEALNMLFLYKDSDKIMGYNFFEYITTNDLIVYLKNPNCFHSNVQELFNMMEKDKDMIDYLRYLIDNTQVFCNDINKRLKHKVFYPEKICIINMLYFIKYCCSIKLFFFGRGGI